MDESKQMDLFGAIPRTSDSAFLLQRLEQEHAEAARIAERLPRNIYFGTSSWSFPGWQGIVYSRRLTVGQLAREGLREYAQHPLLSTVGIDRGFYAPIPEGDLVRYAEQLPAGFPCCAKAPGSVMAPVRPGERVSNPDFLRAERFLEEMVLPFRRAFADHAGPFLLQFPPSPADAGKPAVFAEKLGRFLAALPRDFLYAVELRDPALLTGDYRAALAASGAAHVYNYVTAMPMPQDQAEIVPLETARFVVIRLLLAPGTRYNDRREEFAPFDRIVVPDLEMRRQVVSLVRAASSLGRDVFVLVNNKAEGCSPLTIRALAEMLAESVSLRSGSVP